MERNETRAGTRTAWGAAPRDDMGGRAPTGGGMFGGPHGAESAERARRGAYRRGGYGHSAARRTVRRALCALAAAALLLGAPAALAPAGTAPLSPTVAQAASARWVRSGARWWYRRANGSYPRNGWERVGGRWYLFDGAGWMRTGWAKVSGKWYYLDPSGAMAVGWRKVGGTWYHLDGSGAMAEGWRKVGGAWYYLSPGSGAMRTGWHKVGSAWYWSDASGAMAENRWVGAYWVGASGAMAESAWVDGGRHYVGPDGARVPDVAGGQQSGKVWVPEKGHNEPVYEDVWVADKKLVETAKCNGCGKVFDSPAAHQDHDFEMFEKGDLSHGTYTKSSKVVDNGHYEKKQTGTKWVVDVPGHWE